MKTKQIKYYSAFFFLCSILMLFTELVANYDTISVEIFNTTASCLWILTLIGAAKLFFELHKVHSQKTIVIDKI